MRFSTIVPATIALFAASALAQDGVMSAVQSAVSSEAVDAIASATAALGSAGSSALASATGSASAATVSGASASGSIGSAIAATGTQSSIIGMPSANGTNDTSPMPSDTSDASSMGIHMLPGVAAIGAFVYSGLIGF